MSVSTRTRSCLPFELVESFLCIPHELSGDKKGVIRSHLRRKKTTFHSATVNKKDREVNFIWRFQEKKSRNRKRDVPRQIFILFFFVESKVDRSRGHLG